MTIKSITTIGDVVTIRNTSKGATTFTAHFNRAGWMEVILPPGGEFRLLANIPGVHVDIDDFRAAGLQPLDD